MVVGAAVQTGEAAESTAGVLVYVAERLHGDLAAAVETGEFPAEEGRHG